MIEKPDKITKHCERTGGLYSMKPVTLDLSNISETDNGLGLSLVQNCTTTVNPPMSGSLVTMIDLTTISGSLFVSAAVCAYILRKKDEPSIVTDLKKEENDH
jgi:hypothetical protein